jgi:hypothetical protein
LPAAIPAFRPITGTCRSPGSLVNRFAAHVPYYPLNEQRLLAPGRKLTGVARSVDLYSLTTWGGDMCNTSYVRYGDSLRDTGKLSARQVKWRLGTSSTEPGRALVRCGDLSCGRRQITWGNPLGCQRRIAAISPESPPSSPFTACSNHGKVAAKDAAVRGERRVSKGR